MAASPHYLLDSTNARVATLSVRPEGDLYCGTIHLDEASLGLKSLFSEFEEVVEGQMFGLADEIEDRIARAAPRVGYDDGTQAAIENLQVYPSTGRISFRLKQSAV